MKPVFALCCLAVAGVGAAACTAANNSSNNTINTVSDAGTDGATTSTDGGTSADGGDTDGGNGRDGGPIGTASSCSTGTVWAGDPLYNTGAPTDRPTSGSGIKTGVPFQWQNLVFVDNTLYSRDTGELWAVPDVTAANPVQNRILGQNPTGNYDFKDGPCSSARLGWIRGIAAMPDKSLLLVDGLANAVVHVKDPMGAGCAVEYWAGTNTAQTGMNPANADTLPDPGSTDGAGATAKFDLPVAITTDDAGNAYVAEFASAGSNRRLRKIANDTNHTVSTLVTKFDGAFAVRNLTRIGSKIYAIGDDSTDTWIYEVDSTTGAVRNVITKARGNVFQAKDIDGNDVSTSASLPLHGITTDGTGLIVGGRGFIWYVTTAGVVKHIAGVGAYIDFPKGSYDPKASQPALKLQLPGWKTAISPEQVVGSADFLTFYKGAIYARYRGDGTAAFIEKIACP